MDNPNIDPTGAAPAPAPIDKAILHFQAQTPATYDLPAVAALLSLTPARFVSRRPRLQRAGFPRPLPGAGLVWSAVQVHAWIDANGAPPATPFTAPPNPDIVFAARAALEARYGVAR